MDYEEIRDLLAKTIDASMTLERVKNIMMQSLVIEDLHGVAIGRFILSDGEIKFYVNYLAIDPEFQNKGIGTKLLKNLAKILHGKVRVIRLRSLVSVAYFYLHRGFTLQGSPFLEDGNQYGVYEKAIT